jgi:hypothetical protein
LMVFMAILFVNCLPMPPLSNIQRSGHIISTNNKGSGWEPLLLV